MRRSAGKESGRTRAVMANAYPYASCSWLTHWSLHVDHGGPVASREVTCRERIKTKNFFRFRSVSFAPSDRFLPATRAELPASDLRGTLRSQVPTYFRRELFSTRDTTIDSAHPVHRTRGSGASAAEREVVPSTPGSRVHVTSDVSGQGAWPWPVPRRPPGTPGQDC